MKSTYTIAVNEVIGLSTAETILMQFEYDSRKSMTRKPRFGLLSKTT